MFNRVLLVAGGILVLSCSVLSAYAGSTLTATGGRSINIGNNIIIEGGSLKVDHRFADSPACIRSKPGTKWTFRARQNTALQYPDYLASIGRGKSKHFDISVVEGESSLIEKGNQEFDLHGWYKDLTRSILNNFKPTVRGAIMVDAKIVPSGVEDVTFSRYSYLIPFERAAGKAAPEKIAPANCEASLKESILDALKQTAADPKLALPKGVSSVDVKLVFAGDPEGQNGFWTNTMVDPF